MSEPPFSRILIANRGEIAVRIIQTCRELGIQTVAVYSEADANALHVQRADEAYCIGPAPSLQSYLNGEAILEAARISRAEALHPGYGFLAENAAFARAVAEAGLIWIGPPSQVVALMGDKVAAKELARSAGVPVIPGYAGDEQTLSRMQAEAERVGYPVLLKAAAGGGGKGMRAVGGPEALPEALEGAKREAHSTFGDDRIFLERLLARPRHIEIQVLADHQGAVIHLGERDCSLQRRHQKVVEEAPSPIITEALRARIGADAVRLARASGYLNAGTVEFLFSGDRYYFLEMNTRIQVEHPVTEMVTGLDLVALQLAIAAGRPLSMSQLDVRIKGHAIEARLYAEDPDRGYIPATGFLRTFRPPAGPGIRNDVGVLEGAEVSPFYDPMLAKLIVHAATRDDAVGRLQNALSQYVVLGVKTNTGLLQWIAQQDEFAQGRADTGFLETQWTSVGTASVPFEVLMAAAATELSAPVATTDGGSTGPEYGNPWHARNGWRAGGAARTFIYRVGGAEHRVEAVRAPSSTWDIACEGETRRLHVERTAPDVLVLDTEKGSFSCRVVPTNNGLLVHFKGATYELMRPEAAGSRAAGAGDPTEGLSSPMPGTVVDVAVHEGQQVHAHDVLVVLEAMKMEHVIRSPRDGVVRAVLFGKGDMVPAGSQVVMVDPT